MSTTSTPSTHLSYYSLNPMIPIQTTTLEEIQRQQSNPSPVHSSMCQTDNCLHANCETCGCQDQNKCHSCCACSIMEPRSVVNPTPININTATSAAVVQEQTNLANDIPGKHQLLQTDILSVKASEIDQQHWHLLRKHMGSKRECAFCKKKGLNEYKGDIFLREGTGEVNQCLKCHRYYVQLPIPPKVPKSAAAPVSAGVVEKKSKANQPKGKGSFNKIWIRNNY